MESELLKVPPTHPFASPPELSRTIDSFPTPKSSASRASTEPLPPMKQRFFYKTSDSHTSLPTPSLLSPPQSPDISRIRLFPPHDVTLINEEPLLPLEEDCIALETSLFELSDKNEDSVQRALVSIAKQRQTLKSNPLPQPKEYAQFVSAAWRMCQQAPQFCFGRERAYDHLYGCAVQKSKSSRSPSRPIPATRCRSQDSHHAARPILSRPVRSYRATPKAQLLESIVTPCLATASDSENGVPLRTKPTGGREDNDWQLLADLTPSVSSLPNGNCFKVEWKGGPLSIEGYQHFELLHEAEQKLAAKLRLTPAAYLSSKRRIFIEHVRKYRQGQPFRKTDAQKACKIDVNKASKLWEAYDKVGWFKEEVISQCALRKH